MRNAMKAGLMGLLLLMTGSAGAEKLDAQALIERLQAGGLVVFWRHAATDRSHDDYDLSDMEDCEGQRNLSTHGREQARLVGEGFEHHGIAVEQVLTSEFCRSWETGHYAFGEYAVRFELYNLPIIRDEERREELIEGLVRYLNTPPENPQRNIVVVGHDLNLRHAADVEIEEGEMAVFAPHAEGPRLLGTLKPKDLGRP
ncbi:histidine phosphatase family protein [Thioalkalivibrio sp. ALJ16]|uniref:histidine phosphatase family protein n=1 Tax=Thioalkalivibrio sp. ALJ16 TaxID=1158762 RepID=UPI0003A1150A|nr:histidine phosphatase family protein [Thioalkalivibrio sp. ALJ16]